MERALYNNILSGISLDGRRFFYDNPLASSGSRERVSWPWWCPCCPPNLARLVSSLSGYLYSQRADSIAIHHYVGSEVRANGFTLRVHSGLPFAGENSVEVQTQAPVEKAFLFRIPGWAGSYKLTINGVDVTPPVENGYATLRRTWVSDDRIDLNFELPVRKQFCRYEVDLNRGRFALMRGPLVYCLEEVDNGSALDAVTIPSDAEFAPVEQPDLPDGILALSGAGFRERTRTDVTYSDEPPAKEPAKVTAVPYYAWCNRGAGEMLVWIRRTVI